MKLKRNLNLIFAIIISSSIIFTIYIGVESKDKIIFINTAIFLSIIITLFYLSFRLTKNYIEELLIELSDLIATITDMREIEMFSYVEDNMLSKLQSQVLKLTGILKAKNKNIENEKNKIKSLISDISHQLKTPISNLKMYGELLQDETLTVKERGEFQSIMKVSLLKFEFLVEGMITMSRLESGIIQLKIDTHSLNETILKALKEVHKKSVNKKINITYVEKSNIILKHDKNWTAEGIFNILDNAVKYTHVGGQVNVTIQSYEMFSRIDISDNGCGINEEEIEKVFQRFYRGVNSSDIEGVGIGLYLSREIMMMQGGYIKLNSSKKGSTFSVFIPN